MINHFHGRQLTLRTIREQVNRHLNAFSGEEFLDRVGGSLRVRGPENGLGNALTVFGAAGAPALPKELIFPCGARVYPLRSNRTFSRSQSLGKFRPQKKSLPKAFTEKKNLGKLRIKMSG